MRTRAKVAFLILLTVGGILPISLILTAPSAHGMVRFSSYQDLERFLLTRSQCGPGYPFQYGRQVDLYGQRTLGPAFPASWNALGSAAQSSSSVSSSPSHSETNNQVAGVDELDTVKTDGQYIYTVSNNTVVIVSAYPVTNAQLVSRISILNQTIDGIFLSGNRLAIVSEAPRIVYNMYGACGISTFVGASTRVAYPTSYYVPIRPQVQNTSISVYDLTNRSSPSLQTMVTINGTFIGARQIGTFAYLVTSTPAWANQTLPLTVVNGRQIQTVATQVFHSDISDRAFSYTTILALDTNQNNPAPTVETYLLGTSSTIYVSLTNIFLTQPTWDATQETAIHRISISQTDIKYEATGMVPGHVLNQFSMDENGGYFRVVTSNYDFGGSQTNLYVLNLAMNRVGKLEGLSPGETFYAARFMGDRAYLVTFKRLDPLFVVDLQNPNKPSLLGQLNVTGVSDYLQPYDSSHLIGIGKSAIDVAWENAALFQGLKLSLFDVSNPSSPTDMSDFTVGDRGTDSPGLTDQKAVLFDRTLNLLVLPIEVVGQIPQTFSSTGYSGPIFQGAYVFQVTLQNGIVLRGSITHILNGNLSGYVNSAYYVTRSLYIGSVLYTISTAMIKMNSLTDLSELGSISLA
jgi:inhibitor of cysteine peptidase